MANILELAQHNSLQSTKKAGLFDAILVKSFREREGSPKIPRKQAEDKETEATSMIQLKTNRESKALETLRLRSNLILEKSSLDQLTDFRTKKSQSIILKPLTNNNNRSSIKGNSENKNEEILPQLNFDFLSKEDASSKIVAAFEKEDDTKSFNFLTMKSIFGVKKQAESPREPSPEKKKDTGRDSSRISYNKILKAELNNLLKSKDYVENFSDFNLMGLEEKHSFLQDLESPPEIKDMKNKEARTRRTKSMASLPFYERLRY